MLPEQEGVRTERCFRKMNLGVSDRLISKSIVSSAVKEALRFFKKTTQSWLIV